MWWAIVIPDMLIPHLMFQSPQVRYPLPLAIHLHLCQLPMGFLMRRFLVVVIQVDIKGLVTAAILMVVVWPMSLQVLVATSVHDLQVIGLKDLVMVTL